MRPARPPVIRAVTGAEQDLSFPAIALRAFEHCGQPLHGHAGAVTLDEVEHGIGGDEPLMSASDAFSDHVEMIEGNFFQQNLISGLVVNAAGRSDHWPTSPIDRPQENQKETLSHGYSLLTDVYPPEHKKNDDEGQVVRALEAIAPKRSRRGDYSAAAQEGIPPLGWGYGQRDSMILTL